MHPWERRLKDLGQLLRNCEVTYFDPELFRMNTNQFLQTARTVTFLIQKHKGSIPSYDAWYADNVIKKWEKDDLMKWAKDSRNIIEKEGDLELNSSLAASLIFSYIESEDISIPCTKVELLGANIKRLVRFARKKLPTGITDASAIKIERKWIAKSLPNWELLHALTYVYARMYDCCVNLARNFSESLDSSIPESSVFDQVNSDSRHIRYIKLNDMKVISLGAKRICRDHSFQPPWEVVDAMKSAMTDTKPTNLSENVKLYSNFAKATFEYHGNHVPMLFFFDENWNVIDFISTHFDDTSSKYIFWRSMADRVLYMKPSSMVWICEAWIRRLDKSFKTPIRNMPITGEFLQIYGIDSSGNTEEVNWNIRRSSQSEKPTLESHEKEGGDLNNIRTNVFIPVISAFSKIGIASRPAE